MDNKELLQQALEALTFCGDPEKAFDKEEAAAEALRARLAQPNDFNPDWDVMAAMVEEQQRMAKRIGELEARFAQGEQEPVAIFDEKVGRPRLLPSAPQLLDGQKLYTAPQRKEWQGLTEEDFE